MRDSEFDRLASELAGGGAAPQGDGPAPVESAPDTPDVDFESVRSVWEFLDDVTCSTLGIERRDPELLDRVARGCVPAARKYAHHLDRHPEGMALGAVLWYGVTVWRDLPEPEPEDVEGMDFEPIGADDGS